MFEILAGMLRGLFIMLDKVVAFVITLAYDMILKLADVNVFNPEVIGMFGKRIYALLGIFMLFKLSFSLINYLINPDDFTAKDKGFGKIVTNVMTVILLIVMVPTIFEYAFKFQGEILKNGVMQKLILGLAPSEQKETPEEIAEKDSKLITFAVFSAFYGPNKDIPSIGDKCNDVYATRTLGYEINDITGCALAIKDSLDEDSDFDAILYTFDSALKTNDIDLLYDNSLTDAKSNGKYLFDYKIVISTLVGGIVALILVQFCFDISIRAVKLGFLQLIAPIPIISYIDPKSGKDGMFKKWYKETLKTFLDLFIRLAALFFAIFIISIVAQNKMVTHSDPESSPNAMIQIFVIVGALMFAKQTPKLIGDLTGLKLDGGFSLNPMNRVRQTPLLGGLTSGVAGFAGGALAGGLAGAESGHKFKGAVFGAFSGVKSGVKGIGISGSKDGKSNNAFTSGANTAYKNFTGKDFNMLTPQKVIGRMQAGTAKDELEKLDAKKSPIKNEQTMLDNTYDLLKNQHIEAYKQYQSGAIDQTKYENVSKKIQDSMKINRKKHSDYEKQIKVIDDMKADVKRMYNYDESNKYTISGVNSNVAILEGRNARGEDLAADVIETNRQMREKEAGRQTLMEVANELNTTRPTPINPNSNNSNNRNTPTE